MARLILKKQHLLLIGLMVLLILPAGVSSAAIRDGLRLVPGCEGISSRGGGIILNRDNTGQGRESFTISATDGSGTVLVSITESSFVGTQINFLTGLSFNYTTSPAANPIRVEVVSPAGNGVEAQVIYAGLGSCAGLEFVGRDGEVAVTDFTPSPSVPLNASAPRIVGTEDLRLTETGHVVVTHIGTVNLRSGDGVEYTIVAQADHNDKLTVIGRNASASWWFVSSGEIRGWVNATLVAIRGDLSGVPVVPVQGELMPPRLFVFRQQPVYIAPESIIEVCVIPGGLEYAIVGRNRGGTWYELSVTCGDAETTGWISSEFGAFRNAGLSIPVTE